ncbi:MAG TPA: hypothetical protein VIH18_04415 [Candidatus Binatia bacterium]
MLFAVLSASHAASVTRLANETAENFASRYGPPQTTLVHQVIETSRWGVRSNTIIAFYEQEFEQSGQTYRRIVSYIYLPEGDKSYRKVLIDNFEPEGGDPEIESVFFANVGKSKQTKLFIICSWPQVHYDFRGKLYATFVYAPPPSDAKVTKLKFEEAISKKLEGGCECEWRDGTKSTAKYKTAGEVKAALRTIGR